METTRSRNTVMDWVIGLVAFAVFGVMALYVFLLTRPAGVTVVEWSLILLGAIVAARLAMAALKRRRRLR